jgi:hypothetical protein
VAVAAERAERLQARAVRARPQGVRPQAQAVQQAKVAALERPAVREDLEREGAAPERAERLATALVGLLEAGAVVGRLRAVGSVEAPVAAVTAEEQEKPEEQEELAAPVTLVATGAGARVVPAVRVEPGTSAVRGESVAPKVRMPELSAAARSASRTSFAAVRRRVVSVRTFCRVRTVRPPVIEGTVL